MATFVLVNCKLWFGGYDLSSKLNALAIKPGVTIREASVFGDVGTRRRSGAQSIVAQHRGFWDSDVDAALFDALGLADQPMSFAPETGADGEVGYTFRAIEGAYSPNANFDEMASFTVDAEGSAGERLVRGTVIHNATRTVTGTGTITNLGAILAGQKLYAALHVLAPTGTLPTLDVILQSAALVGFGSPTTRATFTQATALGAQWAIVDGPVTDPYWRVSWTITGTLPSFPFIVVAGIL